MKFLEEEVLEIKKKIIQIRKNMDKALPGVKRTIDYIIENKITSHETIEPLLDFLLTYVSMGVGESEFKRLNEYYESFSSENAKVYEKDFLEMLED